MWRVPSAICRRSPRAEPRNARFGHFRKRRGCRALLDYRSSVVGGTCARWRFGSRLSSVSLGRRFSPQWRESSYVAIRPHLRRCSIMARASWVSSRPSNPPRNCPIWRMSRSSNARVRAYHAADVEPLSPQSLASVPHENLAELTFEIHPSVTIVTSDHPVVTIWSMNVGEAEVGPIDRWIAEDALVTCPRACVETRRLAPGGALLLARLASGAELGAAVQTASADTPNFDLSVVLAEALSAGFFTAFRGDA